MKSKDAELQLMKTMVQETVQTSVQAGIKTYSSQVISNIGNVPVFTSTNDILKKTVRNVIVDDRSKNLLVLGLAEN